MGIALAAVPWFQFRFSVLSSILPSRRLMFNWGSKKLLVLTLFSVNHLAGKRTGLWFHPHGESEFTVFSGRPSRSFQLWWSTPAAEHNFFRKSQGLSTPTIFLLLNWILWWCLYSLLKLASCRSKGIGSNSLKGEVHICMYVS